MATAYDTIGINYSQLRLPDPRIERVIHHALGAAKTVLNVGAGSGSYEPLERQVTAVEPSEKMIRQRHPSDACVIKGYAEELPFKDNAFDAAMAVLTVHHWADPAKGIKEMRRVSRGPVVILTFDPAHKGSWLTDYIPELVALDEKIMPPLSMYQQCLGPVNISEVPVPHDCIDGFLYAYWRRPTAYLDPKVTAAMSSFWAIDTISQGLDKLEDDINTGAWQHQYADLLTLDAHDVGYRLVTTK